MKRIRVASLAAGLTLLTSCGDSGPGFLPFLLFSYSGAQAGTFDAKGAPSSSATPKAFATAVKDDQTGIVIGLAEVVRSSGSVDLAVIAFPASASGSLTINSACDAESGNCIGFALLFDIEASTSLSCELSTGSIVLTKNTTERVAGTFSGSGSCLTGVTDAGTITITNGSFELTFTSTSPGTT